MYTAIVPQTCIIHVEVSLLGLAIKSICLQQDHTDFSPRSKHIFQCHHLRKVRVAQSKVILQASGKQQWRDNHWMVTPQNIYISPEGIIGGF